NRRPVAAHPPSRLYRTKKFIQRHRGGVALTTILVLAILSALALALWQADVARRQAQRANHVRDFLVGLFDAARAHLPRDQRPTPEALVAQAETQLAATTNFDSATRSDLLRTLGEVELSLANFTRAADLFTQAGSLADAAGDAGAARTARVLHADALQHAGRNAQAIGELTPQLDALRASPSPALLRALAAMSAAEMMTGKPDAAIAHRREAAEAAEKIHGAGTIDALAVQFDVGIALADAQRYPESVAMLEPLLAKWRAAHAPEDDRYVAALSGLAAATDGVGDKPATEARYRELLALKRKIYAAPHDLIANTLRDLGLIVARAEKYAEAQALIEEALAMQRRIFGEDHRELAMSYDALGQVFVGQRRFDDADANYRRAIAVCERAAIKEEVCPRAHNNFGMSLYRQDKLDEAKTEMTVALNERRALFGDDHPTVAFSLATLANVAVKQGEKDTAVRLSAQALNLLDRAGRGSARETILIRNGYAQALWMVDRNEEALREIDRTLAEWQRISPDGKSRRVMILVQKAQILRDLKRPDDARRAAEDAIATGANVNEMAPMTIKLLRELSGRADLYPEAAALK
ncbi:MAG TPA: tetratricopeptide repeat protein, partial [Rudaea sp.]